MPLFCSYTWKIYANKMLNMGNLYTFWRRVNNKQKEAKQSYIKMFYNLMFKNLVSQHICLFEKSNIQNNHYRALKMTTTFYMSMSQVKTIPVPSHEPQRPVSKKQSVRKQNTRYAARYTKNFLETKLKLMLNFL